MVVQHGTNVLEDVFAALMALQRLIETLLLYPHIELKYKKPCVIYILLTY